MYQLRCLNRKNTRKGHDQIYSLENSQNIGSSPFSDHGIKINDASLYGQHCRIFKNKNQWIVEALDAPSIGVNEKNVSRSEIHPGDLLEFGDLLLQFEMSTPLRKNVFFADNIWIFWAFFAITLQILIVIFLEFVTN